MEIAFGFIMLIHSVNFFHSQETLDIVMAVLGTVVGACYLCIGALTFFLGDKLAKLFDIVGALGFPLYVLIIYIIPVVIEAENLLAAGWIIYILAIAVSLALIVVFLLTKLLGKKGMARGAAFLGSALALLVVVDYLFSDRGGVLTIGLVAALPLLMSLVCVPMYFCFLGEKKAE